MTTYVPASTIISRLIRLSGQVPGTSVQIYSEDVFLDMLATACRMVARKAWWPHLMETLSGQLDGVTGIVTTDLVGVQDHTDLKAVFIDSCDTPLAQRSDNENPTTGYQVVCYEILPFTHSSYATRLIRVVPADVTGILTIRVRKVPTVAAPTDVVPFDQDLILFGTLWSYFEDEGDNPQQASKYQRLFDAKFTELMSSISNHRVPLTEPSGIRDQWLVGDGNVYPAPLTGEY